jgi:hypothetical protein
MPKRNKNRSNRRGNRRPRNVNSSGSRLAVRDIRPPQISSNPRMRHKFRFAAGSSGAGTYNITNNDILLAAGGIGTSTNSTITAIFGSFKILAVEAWAMAGSSSAATVGINWNGSPVFVSNGETSDTSVSPAYPAHFLARPPKESNASFWQTGSSGTLFILYIPNDTVIDVLMDLVMTDQLDVVTVTAVSSVVVGNQYFLALDGAGSNNLIPQSLNTTH